MGFLNQVVETKKQELIELLISAEVYEVNDQHLYKLTLSELQEEFKRVKKENEEI
ncbi:Fur-regulated basic protein FbpA [Anaerobacillus sp. MEB173]|uniref:Fur-regulated basic protein FbpA n=1 Tax=Anaerobacillus sp. MEB173 TaxID=3383345 RepID=UPI003F8EE56B